jgi:hypothetical protein
MGGEMEKGKEVEKDKTENENISKLWLQYFTSLSLNC